MRVHRIDGPWLLQQHRRLTTRHAARLGRSVAEDLASEAVIRCLRHPAPDGRDGPWLERIFRNLLADHLRRRARLGRLAGAQVLPLPSPSPEEQLLRAELHAVLTHAWSRIDDDQREALLARFSDQGAALARAKGLPLPTIRTRVHRGLAGLRRALGRLSAIVPAFPFSLPTALLQPMATTLAPVTLVVLVLAPGPAAPGFVVATPPAHAVRARGFAQTCRPSSTVAPTPTPAAKPARPAASPPASSSPSAPLPAAPTPRAVTHFEFEADQLVGDLQHPDGDQVTGPAARGRQPSLIEIPSSFVAAIEQSLQDI